MGKFIKFLGWLVATLFVLILLAVFVLPTFVDPNDYRDQMVNAVKQQTGRDLTLDGDLSLSIFPWLGIRTGAVSLSQPAGLDAPDMLSVEAAALSVKLLPLLQSRVEVETIVLTEPRIHMMVSESGQSSLDGLSGEEVSTQESEEDAAAAAVALVVAGVELTDGHLVYDDQLAGQRYELSGLQVVTGNLLGGSLGSIWVEGVLTDSAQPDSVEFRLEGQGAIDTDTYALMLANLSASVVQGAVASNLTIGGLAFAQQSGQATLTDVVTNVDAGLPQTVDVVLPSIVLDMDGQTLNIPELFLTIGDPVLSGSVSVQNFKAPQLTFDLDAHAIDVDHILGPAEEAVEAEVGGMALVLPLAALRGLNANGTFDASSMTVSGMKLTDIDVDVVTLDNTMTITPIAQLYGGELRGEIQFVDHGSEAVLTIKEGVYDVDLGGLLADTGTSDRLMGKGTLDIDLTVTETGSGQTNQGAIKFLARDGRLRGVDVDGILGKVIDLYSRGGGDRDSDTIEATGSSTDETEFSELSGTFNITDQLLTNDDLFMQAPFFRMSGEGQIYLEQASLDYLTTLTVVATGEGQGGQGRSELVGLNIPVRFSGDLMAPSYKIDFGELLKQFVRQKVEGEAKEAIQEQIGEQAGSLLRELLR